MKYCSGGDLHTYIIDFGPFNEDETRNMMLQLTNALQLLQFHGIGHRDLSLDNIIFDDEKKIFHIIDFGMSLKCPRTEESIQNPPAQIDASCYRRIKKRRICGKSNYIAPELFTNAEEFNPMLCDIWALGVIMFRVLTRIPIVEVAMPVNDKFRMIAENRLDEMVLNWGFDISMEALDLLQGILKPEPDERLTLAKIRAHPWMQA
eukprot:CAMPEP_0170059056 /NCGR_PEP_ID=MMETSP0019_2-20121128/1462_1 /TAXON_ID=98059 /ORGANISM="Dinobryon sp., Strain UTEXLB2267" /LENGTH=204 /DNA_ID=CAMNT_0010264181 /DNA_START=306 /DNA_END=920 /DNA_ORIENTATION=-